ncbi:MAG: NosD domain-containing protein, partial [Candidatus Hodarchaeales archaeon]
MQNSTQNKITMKGILLLLLLMLVFLQTTALVTAQEVISSIFIDDNSDFTNFSSQGSGTSSDPYIIEDYAISSSATHLIHIQDTTDFFVIQDCQLFGLSGCDIGIYLYNVTNGKIMSNTIETTSEYNIPSFYGIHMINSSYNNITNNAIIGFSSHGIYLYNSDDNSFSYNYFLD